MTDAGRPVPPHGSGGGQIVEPFHMEPPTVGRAPTGDIVSELSCVIVERRQQIKRIERERGETDQMKALRIAVVEKMIARTERAREVVRCYPDTFDALKDLSTLFDELLPDHAESTVAANARAAIAKATPADGALKRQEPDAGKANVLIQKPSK